MDVGAGSEDQCIGWWTWARWVGGVGEVDEYNKDKYLWSIGSVQVRTELFR
jgi:hypothetical protein